MAATIRLVTENDASAVQAIYAPYVKDTIISFEVEPPDVNEMRSRIQKTLAKYPWLVYEDETGVLGYAYAGVHNERLAYQWSTNVSVYVAARAHRRGIGRALYTPLFALLRLQGFYTAIAGITLPNDASTGIHQTMGFEPIGIYRKVGYKFGKWHDVAWLGMVLQPHADNPVPPRPIREVIDSPEAQALLKIV